MDPAYYADVDDERDDEQHNKTTRNKTIKEDLNVKNGSRPNGNSSRHERQKGFFDVFRSFLQNEDDSEKEKKSDKLEVREKKKTSRQRKKSAVLEGQNGYRSSDGEDLGEFRVEAADPTVLKISRVPRVSPPGAACSEAAAARGGRPGAQDHGAPGAVSPDARSVTPNSSSTPTSPRHGARTHKSRTGGSTSGSPTQTLQVPTSASRTHTRHSPIHDTETLSCVDGNVDLESSPKASGAGVESPEEPETHMVASTNGTVVTLRRISLGKPTSSENRGSSPREDEPGLGPPASVPADGADVPREKESRAPHEESASARDVYSFSTDTEADPVDVVQPLRTRHHAPDPAPDDASNNESHDKNSGLCCFVLLWVPLLLLGHRCGQH